MKKCKTCHETKELNGFRKRATFKDGYSPRCKACIKKDKELKFASLTPEEQKLIKEMKSKYNKERRERKKREAFFDETLTHKKCRKCKETKIIDLFYKDVQIADGFSNTCIECSRQNNRIKMDRWKNKPEYLKRRKESRQRNKAKAKEQMQNWQSKYPEKYLAWLNSRGLTVEGACIHHWSYLADHWGDVIVLSRAEHAKAHRYTIYDQERRLYRKITDNILLDTREAYDEYLKWVLKQD